MDPCRGRRSKAQLRNRYPHTPPGDIEGDARSTHGGKHRGVSVHPVHDLHVGIELLQVLACTMLLWPGEWHMESTLDGATYLRSS